MKSQHRSSSEEDQSAATAPPAAPQAPQSALDEFCMHLSLADKRVELIAAFYASEAAAKRLADTADSYKARFEAFVNAEPIQPKSHVAVK